MFQTAFNHDIKFLSSNLVTIINNVAVDRCERTTTRRNQIYQRINNENVSISSSRWIRNLYKPLHHIPGEFDSICSHYDASVGGLVTFDDWYFLCPNGCDFFAPWEEYVGKGRRGDKFVATGQARVNGWSSKLDEIGGCKR